MRAPRVRVRERAPRLRENDKDTVQVDPDREDKTRVNG